MPSPKSRRRQARRRERNRPPRTLARSRVGQARAAVAAEPESAETADKVSAAIAALDRAVAKGVIHPNAASRRKSRLMKSLGKTRRPSPS